ncbi:MAG: hypothetical protein ABJN95_15910 [Maribacter sp.]|uniref:hypothetical protein n=1 Tax=Maribacter sp. TaxID=1897614 RepID=UPI003296C8F2
MKKLTILGFSIPGILSCLLCLLCYSFDLTAQQSSMDLPNYHPVSPNAASLGNYGLYPVNKNLGSAGVTIPIYTLTEKNITVPINLNYNMSGIRLNDLASWVGLGWSLNAGGVIIRNTKGLPDLSFLSTIPNLQNFAFNQSNWNYLFGATLGAKDTAPDEYAFNALGISGSFYFDRDSGEAIFDDATQVKIIPISEDEIQALLPDGTLLVFGKGFDNSIATERTDSNLSNLYNSNPMGFISAWMLTEIISKDRQHSVSFKYKSTGMQEEYSRAASESVVVGTPTVTPANATSQLSTGFYELSTISKQYLDQIVFDNGYIQFESSLNRPDLADDYQLDAVKVYTYDNADIPQLVDQFHFTYGTFLRSMANYSKDYDHTGSNFDLARQQNSRELSLKLTSVYRGATASKDTKHTFEYNERISLPWRGTTAQDSWGYANTNLGTLLPETTTSVAGINEVPFTLGNGDRSPNENMMKAAVLEKIIYPTGGYTVFEQEANRFAATDFVTESKTARADAFGNECGNTTEFPNLDTSNFIIPAGATNIKLNIHMSPVTNQAGAQSYVSVDGFKFYRPTPDSMGGPSDSSDGRTETIDLFFGYDFEFANINATQIFNPGAHTIEAFDSGVGAFGAYNCSFNRIWITWDEPTGETQQIEQLVGGLRIKSISNYDGRSNTPVSIKKYEYEDANLIQPERNRGYVRRFIQNVSDGIGLLAAVSVSPNFNNNLGGEPTIEYGKVTEIEFDFVNQKDNGKTISYFENIGATRTVNSVIPAYIFKHPQYSFIYPYDPSHPNDPYWTIANWQLLFQKALYGVDELTYYETTSWKRGFLAREETYKRESDNTYTLVAEVDNTYETIKSLKFFDNYVYSPFQTNINDFWYVDDLPAYDQNKDFNSATLCYQIGEVQVGRKSLKQSISTQYDLSGQNPISTTTDYFYDNLEHLQLTRTESTNSKGENIQTKTFFADDVIANNSLGLPTLTVPEKISIDRLKKNDLHRISEPIQVETTVNGETTIQRTNYKDWYNNTDPNDPTFHLVLPELMLTLKGNYDAVDNPIQNRIVYQDYDTNGDPRQLAKADGPSVSYIWGYNKTYPIAKIENATYSQIASFEANLQALSDSDDDRTIGSSGSEGALRTAQNNLRIALPNAMVSTYTYDPLVGVTSMTDPKGYTMYYNYDEHNRLKEVRDSNNNIITDYKYHFKGQDQ